LEDELRREMEEHRAQMGEPPAFGNTLRLRDEARDAWGWRWRDDLVHDTRFAWRTLRRSPGFALTAIVTLALGIGVNTGVISFINGVLQRPLYDDEVVLVSGEREFTYTTYRDVQDGTTNIFAHLATVGSPDFLGVDAGDGARSALVHIVSASYFQVFDAPLAHGRAFTTDEERPGAGIRVAIISYPLWEQFGADASVLGRLIRINGDPFTVVGVARNGFQGLSIPGPEVWLPLGARETGFTLLGRLRPGTSLERAAAAVAAYSLDVDRPGRRLMFVPSSGGGSLTGLILLLMLMPGVVLLVACLNLADLLLARGHVRRQELAVRSSIGGGRLRLTRQILTEGLLLALAGGALGLWLSTWAIRSLVASVRAWLPVAVGIPDVSIDWRVLVVTIGFTLGATLVFGAGPALALTRRVAAADLTRQAGDEGRRPGGFRTGNTLVIAQIALSLLLLASGGLFLMSAIGAARADPGFRLDGGLVVQVDPGLAGYDEAQGRQAHLALIERLRAVPGVEAVSIGSRPPFTSIGDSRDVIPAGAPVPPSDEIDGAVFSVIGRDYARTLGLAMLRGRDFTEAELLSGAGERVAIIDTELAEQLWPGEDALGRPMQFVGRVNGVRAAENPPLRVVGIMPAVKHSLGNPRPAKHVYVPLGQH
jgi:predicted permease